MERQDLIAKCSPQFQGKNTSGLDGWFNRELDDVVWENLENLDTEPLDHAKLDQLLRMSGLGGVSEGFFEFYWKRPPANHPHSYSDDVVLETEWQNGSGIANSDHFIAGWSRFYIDALVYHGDIERAYDRLRTETHAALCEYFERFRHDTSAMSRRARGVLLKEIPQDDRFLIGETACKTLEGEDPLALDTLLAAFRQGAPWSTNPTFRDLVARAVSLEHVSEGDKYELDYVTDEFSDSLVDSEQAIAAQMRPMVERFNAARSKALANTRLYLSLASDLDVYVATSMRRRDDYRQVANLCEVVFGSEALIGLNVRFFDPTISAASGHEDKGLVECLMVRSAKALVYVAGDRDSWGKDSEATMALTQGKPVIFYCHEEVRKRIFADIHPLSRLITFDRAVPVGVMVVSSLEDVIEILKRVFTNSLQYRLRRDGDDRHLRLEETVSGSVVRLQSQDDVLRAALREAYKPSVH